MKHENVILNQLPPSGYRWLYGYTDDLLRSSSLDNYRRAIKIGDTDRTVYQRVYVEQDGTDRPIKPDVILTLLIPESFRDKDVHAVLETMGHEKLRVDKDREFFVIKEEEEVDRVREIQLAVQRATKDRNTGRFDLELTPDQYRFIEDALDAFESGHTTILGELCPRFGKTPVAMALHVCRPERVMVVATYWLSALSSFKNDVVKFKQFVNVRYVDASEDNYHEKVQQYLDQGLKVVIGVSLHKGKGGVDFKKEDLQPIANIDDRWVFVDEADFGAWRKGQKEIVDFLIGE